MDNVKPLIDILKKNSAIQFGIGSFLTYCLDTHFFPNQNILIYIVCAFLLCAFISNVLELVKAQKEIFSLNSDNNKLKEELDNSKERINKLENDIQHMTTREAINNSRIKSQNTSQGMASNVSESSNNTTYNNTFNYNLSNDF